MKTTEKNLKSHLNAVTQRYWQRFIKHTDTDRFGRFYMWSAFFALLLSTLFWSILSARINQSNADQLVDPLLFTSGDTFINAQFPIAHTFLFKWPLFYMVKVFGFTPSAYVIFTVICTLLTVSIFAYILHRIDKRPMVFGTVCLAIASILMMIPTTPHAGALIPVNMAMLATRNLEYIIYIAALVLLSKAKTIRSRHAVASIIVLSILIASDKLFLSLTIGSALIASVMYGLSRKNSMTSFSFCWLGVGVGALISSMVLLWVISASGLTQIIGNNGAGPYGVVRDVKTGILGISYMITGVLTNLGANPAPHTTELRDIPGAVAQGIFSTGGPAYILNGLILVLGVFACYKLLRSSFARKNNLQVSVDTPARLAIALLFSAMTAVAVFIATDHYYPADARYLAITFFAVIICIVVYVRSIAIPAHAMALTGLLLFGAMLLGSLTTLDMHRDDAAALEPINRRNASITQALGQHEVGALVGDYWRTVPTRVVSKNKIDIVPLADCTTPRDVLTSGSWDKDLRKTSFAYLLSLERGPADYPACSLDQVVDEYGEPNASLVMDGSIDKPKELLLLYDGGTEKSSPAEDKSGTRATVNPIRLAQLPEADCESKTIMNIVAHQDDDLLFMNPDLHTAIKQGSCIRTVYLTAGDAGGDEFYWLKREQGAQAAYDSMLASTQVWVNRIVKLGNGQFVNVTNPRGNEKISLVFLHLPDGNLRGEGFPKTNHENLERLESGAIDKLHSIDGHSVYTDEQLVSELGELMTEFTPAEIRAQSSSQGSEFHDHSDHLATGRYAKRAYEKYQAARTGAVLPVPLRFYLGYPINERIENVSGSELSEKETVFMEYAKHDSSVCQSIAECDNGTAYGIYLKRQYDAEQ